jgi:HD-GYP domain-containing protein (c-di-GMP phosphodiesterase class II)
MKGDAEMIKILDGALPDFALSNSKGINRTFPRRRNGNAVLAALLANILEKSCETKEHSDRMADLALSIGQKLGLSAEHLRELVLLADFHDVGKTIISDKILNKTGQLSEEEWAEMKMHPLYGYKIAQVTPDIQHLADGILYHHERWDGCGYPHGLAGSAIPLSARIIAVVDAFDAMTHDRPYRPAMGLHDATSELKMNAGTQFDPTIVDVFIDLMRKYL